MSFNTAESSLPTRGSDFAKEVSALPGESSVVLSGAYIRLQTLRNVE